MSEVKYDEIDYWTEIKLDIVKEYATRYTTILSHAPYIKKLLYIDAFAGAGVHISKQTGEFIPGSPMNALLVKPPFSEIHLIDVNGDKAEELRKLAQERKDVFVHEKDCNKILETDIFPRCRYKDYNRALCLLDPYGIHLNWSVIATAGRMKSIEIFLNFSIMDMNMNVLKHNPDNVKPEQVERMNAFWGDESWHDVAYSTQQGLFDKILEKTDNKDIADAFRKRLKDKAGFQYVPEPLPMRNSKGAIIYYLFFASPNPKGDEIVEYIFNKWRNRGMV